MVKTILVVDDYTDILISVKQVLEATGSNYRVIGVDNGEKCLQMLRENKLPDLILLDIMMPGMNGWEVAARIKENSQWRNVPIVFLTAKDDDMSVGIGRLSSEEYIVKPFDVTYLKECVNRILKET